MEERERATRQEYSDHSDRRFWPSLIYRATAWHLSKSTCPQSVRSLHTLGQKSLIVAVDEKSCAFVKHLAQGRHGVTWTPAHEWTNFSRSCDLAVKCDFLRSESIRIRCWPFLTFEILLPPMERRTFVACSGSRGIRFNRAEDLNTGPRQISVCKQMFALGRWRCTFDVSLQRSKRHQNPCETTWWCSAEPVWKESVTSCDNLLPKVSAEYHGLSHPWTTLDGDTVLRATATERMKRD